MAKYGVFSCSYSPVFSSNTGKYGPEKKLHISQLPRKRWQSLSDISISVIARIASKSFSYKKSLSVLAILKKTAEPLEPNLES